MKFRDLNAALSQKGPVNDEQREIFNTTLERVAPGRTDITTWFDLLDLDDAHALSTYNNARTC